ncbi:BA14K family protein [Rhizobium sp. BK251]|uniref:BA14K family protein n=1 Tax=Rhizobium sp. BK251 TaxID=2512125 RepID=UPI00104B5A28|nr:BA14K family protein [Rhizobium sp. BK251]TCL69693.1 BA14K-like protein [Rhizobium sp. BK251]
MKKLAVVIISFATAFIGISPAQAFPIANIEKPAVTPNVEQVRYNGWYRHHGYGGHRYYGGRYYGGRYYHHHHNYTGAIIGGLAAGAIIGGALSASQEPRYYYSGDSHTRWCYGRYRSYRASDNTFQPNNGPRQQCVSP